MNERGLAQASETNRQQEPLSVPGAQASEANPTSTFKLFFTHVEPKNSWVSMTPGSQMNNSAEKKIL